LKHWTLLLSLALAAYLLFALISFPARVAVAWFAPGQVQLAGLQGTLWSGQAALGALGGLPLSELTWDLKPTRLLFGRLAADVATRLADGFVEGSVSVTPSRLVVTDLRGTTRLSSLQQLLPLGGVDGLVTWQMERLEVIDQWPVRAIGRLRVASLSAVPFGVDNLGDYQVDFADAQAGEGVAGIIKDTGGPLSVAGNLALAADRSYQLSGRVTARPGASEALVNGLTLLGNPGADGSRRFEYSGQL